MTDEAINKRRSPVRRAIAAMLLVLLMYPVSFGPACWIATRQDSQSVFDVFQSIYGPLIYQLLQLPESLDEPVSWYLGLGAPDDSELSLGTWISTKRGKRTRALIWHRGSYTYTAGSMSID